MSQNHRAPERGYLSDFLRDPEPTNADLLAEIRSLSHKVDVLRAELVRRPSTIILEGADITRIADEIRRAATNPETKPS